MTTSTASSLLMVRPCKFGSNPDTAENNAFQQSFYDEERLQIINKAKKEFDAFVKLLRENKVKVTVAEDTEEPEKPDSVFPNNWISTHESATIVTYPMFAVTRRLERREDIVAELAESYQVKNRVKLEKFEEIDSFLEGTGSMVLDRVNKIAYACISPRTNPTVLQEFATEMEYNIAAFKATDNMKHLSIYHTNVMMALGKSFVIICLEAITCPEERSTISQLFDKTGKQIIEISFDQMNHFAGNMLEIEGRDGKQILVMSEQAYHSLRSDQIDEIKKHVDKILHTPLYTIEKYGGGSARCMLAEIFLPQRIDQKPSH